MNFHPFLRASSVCILALGLLRPASLGAQVPAILSYQGRLVVANTNYDGVAEFQFALVDETGTTSYWSNDGSSVAGSRPGTSLPANVSKGLYSVLLGDTSLPGMAPIPPTVFSHSDVRLRVWFRAGTPDFRQLDPDQRFAAVGYALMAAEVADGSVNGSKIALGAVDNTKLANSGLTVTPGTGLAGGGLVSLGGNVSLGLADGGVGNAQLAANAVQTANLADGVVSNAKLANPGFTVTAGNGLTGGGSVTLGGAVNLNTTATAQNTPSAIVQRDGAGNFSAGTITATAFAGVLRVPGNTNTGGWAAIGGGLDNLARGFASTISGGENNSTDSNYTAVGGGFGNAAIGLLSTIGGGHDNLASGENSTVAGGFGNWATNSHATIGGGYLNQAYGGVSTVAGGTNNHALGTYSAIGGGSQNTADGYYATVSGGTQNSASGTASTVSGGFGNAAAFEHSTVGGGAFNQALGTGSTISGGLSNVASDTYAAVGGGRGNLVGGSYSTVGGGFENNASSLNSTIGGGEQNTAAGNASTVAGGAGNEVYGARSTVGGGENNTATNSYATIGGGVLNMASGERSTISGGEQNTAAGNASTVAGGEMNTATNKFATIGGGEQNTAAGDWSTVAGGRLNKAADGSSTVAGGNQNTALGLSSTVGGGEDNNATNIYATIGGGHFNTAGGEWATVPGGRSNAATGDRSFAAGTRAKAEHYGSFVWADGNDLDFPSDATNQFNIRASGGTRIFSTSEATIGVQLAPGGNAWNVISDRHAKENFTAVNYRGLLDKLDAVPVTTWNLKSQDAAIRHIGPMAQDFKAAFAVGEDERHISTSDADGVAFAAIKGLRELLREKDAEVAELKAANGSLAKRLAAIERRLDQLANAATLAPSTGDRRLVAGHVVGN